MSLHVWNDKYYQIIDMWLYELQLLCTIKQFQHKKST